MLKVHNILKVFFFLAIIYICSCTEDSEPIIESVEYTYSQPIMLDDGWETESVHNVNLDTNLLNKIGYKLLNKHFPNIHSLLIVKNGKLVFEEYYHHYTINTQHDLRSATKSITSLLTGISIQEGFIESVENKILPYFPEYPEIENMDTLKNQISIKDLLTMRSGLDSDDWLGYDSPGYEVYVYNSYDWIKFMLDLPMAYIPGEHFAYTSGGVIVLGGVIANASGMSIPDFSEQYLFGPIGISNFEWRKFPAGGTDTGGHIYMLPRDMAKIGQLILNNGIWNNVELINKDWLDKSIEKFHTRPNNPDWGRYYGYLWWLSEVEINEELIFSLSASGNGGQVITIFPELDLIVVSTGGNFDENDRGYPFVIMEEFILPALTELQK